jgi:hypothetical protein
MICSKCKQDKPVDDFHKNRSRPSGYAHECKACKNKYISEWKSDNAAHVKDYAKRYRAQNADPIKECKKRWQKNNESHVKEYQEAYQQSERGKKAQKAAKIRHRMKHADHCYARDAVNHAIKRGEITEGPCEICGSKEKIHAHHDDYSKPLKVRWLCAKHHNEFHKQERTRR